MVMTDKIYKCIFPAAGYGTRFLPATKSMPKEMLPIMDRPLIHYGVKESYEAGMNDITFVVGRNKEAIVNYFDVNYELESVIKGTDKEEKLTGIRELLENCNFSYIRQPHISGLGDAINCARTHVEKSPFAVLLSDDFCVLPAGQNKGGKGGNGGKGGIGGNGGKGGKGGMGGKGGNEYKSGGKNVLANMQDIYMQQQCGILAVAEVPPEDAPMYGVVNVEEQLSDNLFKINGMVEKPAAKDAPSNLAIIGRYIVMPSIFEYLDKVPPGKGGELQITDALNLQIKDTPILAYKIESVRFDCGSHKGFNEALLFMMKHYPVTGA